MADIRDVIDRLNSLESRVDDVSRKESAFSAEATATLGNIRDNLVLINASVGRTLSILSSMPVPKPDAGTRSGATRERDGEKASEFGWLKLLGFGLFAAAPLLIGLLRNLDPAKIQQTLNNVLGFFTNTIPNFLQSVLPSLFNQELMSKMKSRLSEMTLLEKAALIGLLATFKGTIFSLLYQGLKGILSLPFFAAKAVLKCAGVVSCLVKGGFFALLRGPLLVAVAGAIGWKIGEEIKKLMDMLELRETNEQRLSRLDEEQKQAVRQVQEKTAETGVLQTKQIPQERLDTLLINSPPAIREMIEKRVDAIREAKTPEEKEYHTKQLLENTGIEDEIGGSLNLGGILTEEGTVIDPRQLRDNPNDVQSAIKRGSGTAEDAKLESSSASPAGSSSMENPEASQSSPSQDAVQITPTTGGAGLSPSGGSPEVETGGMSNPQSNLSAPTSQSIPAPSSNQMPLNVSSPSIDGKQLSQTSQEATRPRRPRARVITGSAPTNVKPTAPMPIASLNKDFISVDEVPDPTVNFNNLEEQLFFSAA